MPGQPFGRGALTLPVPPQRRLSCRLDPRGTRQHLRKDGGHLHAGEVGAEADVRAVPEGEVGPGRRADGIPVDVKGVG